ncbi:MAG: DUF2182 domain-containing protein, partial [Chloroflexota bacterium]
MTQTELAPFLGAWTLMMAAMMLPSAAPMVLLHRVGLRGSGALRSAMHTAVFVGAYLLVWGSIGVVVWAAGLLVEMAVPMAIFFLAMFGVV